MLSVAVQPTALDDKSYDRQRTSRKRAAVLAQVGRHEFDPRGFEVIEDEPIVYWWSKEFLARYAAAPKLASVAPVRTGCLQQATTFGFLGQRGIYREVSASPCGLGLERLGANRQMPDGFRS